MMWSVDRAAVDAWMGRYVKAWESNDPDDIRGLFTEDARYYTAPHREPWSGQEAIVAGWLDGKDEPGDWTFRHDIIGIDGDRAFVRGWTTYRSEPDYSNLWVIRLNDEGRCSEFIEWWMTVET